MEIGKYFGGTGITLEKLKEICPTVNVDGTTYKIENWLKECEVFDKLIPNVSKVWVPYGGAEEYGILRNIVWTKLQLGDYDFPENSKDWWIYEPHLEVELNGVIWYVYEVTFYKTCVKRKSQIKELRRRQLEPKRKFLSRKDLINLKIQEAIENRKLKSKKMENKQDKEDYVGKQTTVDYSGDLRMCQPWRSYPDAEIFTIIRKTKAGLYILRDSKGKEHPLNKRAINYFYE